MEDRKEKNESWMAVPQFGDWDQKGAMPDYSLDFSKIREKRKQNKRDISRASLGNEDELIISNNNNNNNNSNSSNSNINIDHHQQLHLNDHPHLQNHSPTTRRRFLSYFNCCIKA